MNQPNKNQMSEENIIKMFETMADILAEKYGVDITVTVSRKDGEHEQTSAK